MSATEIIDVEYRVITPPNRRDWWLAALIIGAAWLIYALPWLFGGMVIPWDAKDFYYPMLRFLAASLAQGEPGQWNPYLYSGFPAIADPQSWYFTPTMRIFATAVPAPSMTAMDAVILLHLLAGAIGLLLLVRQWGLRPTAAILAGFVFMFGGVAFSRLQHNIMIVSYAYLPWAILLLTLACESPRMRVRLLAAVTFGLIAGCMAIDRNQIAFLNALLLLAMATWQVLRRTWPQPIEALRTALALSPALVTGAFVLALPMLLTLDLLAMSTRPEIDFTTAGHGSLNPAAFLTLLDPDFFGSLRPTGYWGPGELPWMNLSALGYDWTDPPVNHFYIGLTALVLLGAAFSIRTPGHPYWRFFAAVFVAIALYTVGAHTPVFRVIYDWVPGVDLFRRPNDAAFLVNACLAVLVAFATEAVLSRPEDGAHFSRWRALFPILALLALGAGALWIGGRFDHGEDAARSVIVTIPLALLLFALIASLRGRLPSHALAIGLILAVGGDLIWHHSGANLSARPQESIRAYQAKNAVLAAEIRARLGSGTDRGRVEILGLGGSWQNAALVYQLEQTLGYDPVRLADYERLSGSQQNNHLAERRLTATFTGYGDGLATMLGIRMVVAGEPIEKILPNTDHRSLTYLGPFGDAHVYQNNAALPRAMILPRAPRGPSSAGSDIELPMQSSATVSGTVELVSYRQSEVLLWARAEQPAWLILHDLYHPAWTATVDNEPVPILRANRLFRAVALEPGEHSIRFAFEPLRWRSLKAAAERVRAAYGPGATD